MRPNTTIRGGFGLYAYNWSLDTYGGGMGGSVSSSGSLSDNTGITPVALLGGPGNVFGTAKLLPYTAASQDPTRVNGQGAGYTQYHPPVPKIYQWNLSAERQVTTNAMFRLAYVGRHGFNLASPTDRNPAPL